MQTTIILKQGNTFKIFKNVVYIKCLVTKTMVINRLWNKRHGPGGGTRRLHHFMGGELESTSVVKVSILPGIVPPLSGYLVSANMNTAPAANRNGSSRRRRQEANSNKRSNRRLAA